MSSDFGPVKMLKSVRNQESDSNQYSLLDSKKSMWPYFEMK